MLNNYSYFIEKHDLKVDKVTKKGNLTIISTPLGQFVFKKNDIKIYNYLLSRGFNYFPRIVDYHDDIIMFDYIENIEYDIDEKALDYIKLISYLHSKTNYYKQSNLNEYKEIYDNLYKKIVSINNYYLNMINLIESKEYMSPCEYLVARNITNIFMLINHSFKSLDEWYESVKNNTKKRVVTLYNNIDLNNLIKSTDYIYLTSFNNTSVDNPIYDLYSFYNKYYNSFDFNSIISKYEEKLKLTDSEIKLLSIMISIPERINIVNDVKDMSNEKKKIDKLYSSINYLNSKKEEGTSTHQDEDNK